MDASRRESLKGLAALGLGLGLIGTRALAAEPSPETKSIRLIKYPGICQAPVFVAEELLRTEGFTDISYVVPLVPGAGPGSVQNLSDGQADMGAFFAAPLAIAIDRGAEISVLGGVHSGCFELFTASGVRSIKDLKGKTVAVQANESANHVFVASIATSVGLDPNRDIQWDFPEGHRHLCERPRPWREGPSRPWVHTEPRVRAIGAARVALRPLARLQPRGDTALLRAAAA